MNQYKNSVNIDDSLFEKEEYSKIWFKKSRMIGRNVPIIRGTSWVVPYYGSWRASFYSFEWYKSGLRWVPHFGLIFFFARCHHTSRHRGKKLDQKYRKSHLLGAMETELIVLSHYGQVYFFAAWLSVKLVSYQGVCPAILQNTSLS